MKGDKEIGRVPNDQFVGAGIVVIVSMCVRFDRHLVIDKWL